MYSKDSAQLRAAFSALAVCAVLAAAVSSGAQRATPNEAAMNSTPTPSLVRAIVTLVQPDGADAHVATTLDEARLRSSGDTGR
ncbi:hypothetical protein [Roseiarcus fermentans]|uniref:hypothetical protein n=1 Tax=Roseiarcus fermentans TaxID=1473586 RepID=UPI0011BFC338|nr:hypothetical protein [Roseiarcus fermentans]